MHIEPTEAQLGEFLAPPDAEPVFMLNLLRFRDQAHGMPGVTGMEAYLRYAAATQAHLERAGGELQWAGRCDQALIGPAGREWHVAAIVRYPSRTAFLAMVSDPEYIELSRIRSASLADSRLIPCAETSVSAEADA